MSDDMPPPKRKESDLTIRIDRSLLPPISTNEVAAMGLDPEEPELRELMAQNLEGRQTAETLVECPRCTEQPCPCCAVRGMVTSTVAARYEATKARLEGLTEPEDEPA